MLIIRQRLPKGNLFIEKACDGRPPDAHCALRTEFLTAEAVDAAPAVDVRPAVCDRNGMGRADIAAHAAADAQRPLQARPRPQRKRRRLPEQAAEGAAPRAEIRPRPMLDDPEIRAGKGRGIPRNAELRRVERRQAALGRCAQRRHILRLQPDE